ncbi:MAG TPA: DUF6159 family protein [Caldilineaceae bacterium]|nr:DUF6159 family protein [Caldilineaceae bacterium]
MFKRYGPSWRLVESSFDFLLSYPDLLLYPIISMVMAAVGLALMALSVLVWSGYDPSFFFEMSWVQSTALTFAFYVMSYSIGIYCNTALTATALQLSHGQPPDMRAAWRLANSRLLAIFGYAVMMATLGMALRLLLRPTGALGKLLAPVVEKSAAFTLIGLAWQAIPYFVAPVLLQEQVNPWTAVQRSSRLVKEHWGNDVVVNASVWVIFALPLFLMLLLGIPAIAWAVAAGNEATVVGVVYVVVMMVLLTWLLKMTMDGIFSAVTYRYVVENEVDSHFDEDALRQAFSNRPNRLVNRIRRWLRRG